MRPHQQLYGCAAAAVLVMLYFLLQQRSAGFGYIIPSSSRGIVHRVVVFGDDWSDTGNYRVSPPSRASVAARDPDRGSLWTETLCKEASQETQTKRNQH